MLNFRRSTTRGAKGTHDSQMIRVPARLLACRMTLPFGSSDRSSTLDDSFHRQALSPCWTRILLQDANANADARMLRQIGTLTATAKVVHALRDWRWEPLSRAGDDPAH